ncbi:DUF6498-containing protein [Bradyrhizobium sp. CCGUVB23]|uniref:DUF6498-containing protein n=1 Tax=Bradyrhizobium sp. CCGUVB23 TaxID=2949630 RepID=UPI0020B17FF1|nr:DUF6498-containing protein [Bradyrhizobium sp. CCGUVB23]MCP3463309.1 DUF6498-containing protein [Bradyrhizobium sp. CCGUVB23]
MPVLIAQNLLTAVANGLPLYGVLYRGTDPFQVLMLYWMETAVAGFWMLMTLARLPQALLGDITVNGRTRRATNSDMVKLFSAVLLVFMAGHLLFLWVIFSGDWSQRVSGPLSFVQAFVLHSGAWAPLTLMFLGGLVGYVRMRARPHAPDAGTADAFGSVVGATLVRIVMMQAGIIFGGMLARSYGSRAPFLILIGLKTLFDMRRR